jgi:hypothetical protein
MMDARERDGMLVAHHDRQRTADEQLHGEEPRAVPVLPELEPSDPVRVMDRRGDLGLAAETQRGMPIRAEVRVQDLDRHDRAGVEPGGPENLTRRAAPDQRINPVAVGDNARRRIDPGRVFPGRVFVHDGPATIAEGPQFRTPSHAESSDRNGPSGPSSMTYFRTPNGPVLAILVAGRVGGQLSPRFAHEEQRRATRGCPS